MIQCRRGSDNVCSARTTAGSKCEPEHRVISARAAQLLDGVDATATRRLDRDGQALLDTATGATATADAVAGVPDTPDVDQLDGVAAEPLTGSVVNLLRSPPLDPPDAPAAS